MSTKAGQAQDTFRFPTIQYLDLRLSKPVMVNGHRLELIVDLFNLTNSNVVTNLNPNTGSAFQNPLDVLSPRGVRIGGR